MNAAGTAENLARAAAARRDPAVHGTAVTRTPTPWEEEEH